MQYNLTNLNISIPAKPNCKLSVDANCPGIYSIKCICNHGCSYKIKLVWKVRGRLDFFPYELETCLLSTTLI